MASCGDSADSGDDTSTTPIAGSTGLVDCDVDDNAEPLPTTATVGFADTCEISFAGARNVARNLSQPSRQITIIVRSLTHRRNEFVVLDSMRVNDFLQLVAERFELFVSAFELRDVVTHVRLRPGGQSLRTIDLRDRSVLYMYDYLFGSVIFGTN